MAKGRAVADAVKAHRHDQEVFAFARDLSEGVIGGLGGGELSSLGSGAKSRRLSFKGLGGRSASDTARARQAGVISKDSRRVTAARRLDPLIRD